MTAINSNDQALRIWMLAGTNQVYSNFANVTAVANSKTALLAIWSSNVALTNIKASTAAINALVSSSYTTYICNYPGNLSSAMVSTKSILLQEYSGGVDTIYLSDLYSNGVLVGNWTYTEPSATWQTHVLPFSNIRHYKQSDHNYQWFAYIIDCD
jgi:hypothetical protein